jgi:hypothetical protein
LAVQQFLASKNMTVVPHPLLAWFSPLCLLPLPQDENQVEAAKIWHRRGDPGRIAEGTGHVYTKRLPGQFPGRNVGIVVYAPKGATLKGTVAIRTLSVSAFFFWYISGTFG